MQLPAHRRAVCIARVHRRGRVRHPSRRRDRHRRVRRHHRRRPAAPDRPAAEAFPLNTESRTEIPMLFMVQMQVNLPPDMPAERADKLKADEKALAQQLQRDGKWPHLWRVAGRYANVSIFDVENNDELHQLLSSLPLFPYMDIQVTALARHPSAISSRPPPAAPPALHRRDPP